MTRRLAAAALGLMLAACAGAGPRGTGPAVAPAPRFLGNTTAPGWVDRTLARLTPEQKVGQLLMTQFWGDFSSVGSPDFEALRHAVEDVGVGGITISIGSPPEIAGKVNAAQARARIPLLVAADVEYGPAMRLWSPTYLPYLNEGGGGTVLPYNMGIGAIGDTAAAHAAGLLTAQESRAVGINWIFAPDADVNNNPANPIINVRSYGADARLVGALSAAYVHGVHAGHALTAAKHFPGHGDTGVDSHVSLPVIAGDRARLDTVELPPFRAAIAAGTDAVMVGHLGVPALTAGEVEPATLSPALATDLLRRQLGFQGIVITDAMTMGALRDLPGMGPGELAVRAVQAGADIVLFPPDLDAARDALLEAVRDGRISQARIDASVRRVLQAKAALRLRAPEQVPLDSVVARVANAAHQRVADELAARSLVLARDSAHRLPLDPRQVGSVAVIAIAGRTDLNAGKELTGELERIYGRAREWRLYPGAPQAEVDAAVDGAARADAVVIGTFFGPVAGQGYVTGPGLQETARRILATGKPVVVVSFGDPYAAAALPGASTYLLAWQPRGAPAQRAAARALAGLAPITGTLPVDIPGAPGAAAVPRGRGIRLAAADYALTAAAPESVGLDARALARADSIVEAGIADHATPGAALAIGRGGRLVRLRGYGRLDYRPGFGPVTDSTLYDLASLTKVIGTTTAAMWAVEHAGLDLDRPVTRYLPEFHGDSVRNAITVRQLLTHSSGLTSRMLWRTARGRAAYLKTINDLPLAYAPGSKSQYSDFNLILVGLIIERLTGKPLDMLLQQKVFGPLGMRDTRFNPLVPPERRIRPDTDCTAAYVAGSPLLRRIAPTEIDTIYRHRQVQGIVHDENACALGGVAGHAGLFSSARDLAVFAQMLLDGGSYRGVRVLRPATIRTFTTRQSAASTRALGWDTPGPAAFIPEVFSPHAFGHTGFTGTSIWVDPERDLFVVLLTNRVDPTRDNQKIGPLRRAVADAVVQALAGEKAAGAVQP